MERLRAVTAPAGDNNIGRSLATTMRPSSASISPYFNDEATPPMDGFELCGVNIANSLGCLLRRRCTHLRLGRFTGDEPFVVG